MSDFTSIIYKLHPLERKVLKYLDKLDISEIAKLSKLSDAEVTTAVQLLEQKGFTNYEKQETKKIVLDKFGEKFLQNGLPEIQVLQALGGEKKSQEELGLDREVISSALGILKRNQLIDISKGDKGMVFTPKEKAQSYLEEHSTNPLTQFAQGVLIEELTQQQQELLKEFKPRKGFLKEVIEKSFSLSLTAQGKNLFNQFSKEFKELDLLETLESDMLKSKSWKGREFRHYDVTVQTQVSDSIGRRHPMHEANNVLRDIFLEMGFSEMRGPMVESAFWNMDVMWIPQDHPARDEQDTFYLHGSVEAPQDKVELVKEMHEGGIKRTHTLEGEWSERVTQKRLLRTHSTATSFRKLSELGERLAKGEDINGKYFYLANVFRNEAVDATHLAEFFQGEGFIVGDNLSLADLMGFVKEYLARLGFHKVKFKPTFNPYTEPSMEAHIYDEEIGKWYALINSGIFRPETLEPFGLGNKRIIAWGFGASRIAAKLAQKESMRDITGYTCDLQWLKSRALTRRRVKRAGRRETSLGGSVFDKKRVESAEGDNGISDSDSIMGAEN